MSKRVLVVSYSQSGQLARLQESFLRNIRGAAGIEVDDVVLQPAQPMPFPKPYICNPPPSSRLFWHTSGMTWW